ncbi:MAG: YbaK/EbsC family protein [Melioribacteraceae bacterium]|jgi:Ala-tRNA(Pro) deacylase|nr:YbaK/EbsC family protein [Melioribacteraceae bacterium]
MPLNKLKEYLDSNQIRYVTIKHSLAFTAQEIAASAHIKGKDIAKTVILKVEGKLTMFVLPGSYKVDIEKVKEVLNTSNVRLADEMEFKDKFADCEIGAFPPFGNLYDIDVYCENALLQDENIAFNSCSHTQLFQMKLQDYINLVHPMILNFAYPTKL